MNSAVGKITKYLAAFVVLAAAFCISALFGADYATALDATLEYPTDGYIQQNCVDYISANADYVATFDKNAGKLVVEGKKSFTLRADGFTVKGIYFFGDSLAVFAENDGTACNKLVDLTAVTPGFAPLSVPDTTSYMTSDGTSLFAHTSGSVRKYSDDMTLAATYADTAFLNSPVITANNGKLYLFSVEYGVNKFTVYDTESGNAAKTNCSVNALAASCGSVAYVHDGTKILAFPFDYTYGDEPLFDTELTSINFCAYGDKLYVANGENGYSIYTLNEDGNGVDFFASYGMSGEEINRLSSPTDVIKTADGITVADTGNDRVLFASDSSVSAIAVDAPIALSEGGDGRLFAASRNKVSVLESGRVSSEFSITGGVTILDAAYLDALYVLTSTKIYALSGGAFEECFALSGGNAVKLAATENGEYLYVLTANGVDLYSKDGEKVFSDSDAAGAIDLAVDYDGNYYCLYSGGTVKAYDGMKNLTEYFGGETAPVASVISFDNTKYEFSPISVSIGSDGKLYAATSQSAIISIDASAKTKQNHTASASPDVSQADLAVYSVSGLYCFTDLNRLDTLITADGESQILVYQTESGFNGYKYGIYHGKNVFIFENTSLAAQEPTAINAEYIANKGTALYPYPGAVDGKILYSVGRTIRIDDNASDFDGGKWFRTTYNGKKYFVPRSDLDVYTPPAEEEDEQVFGKAKAERAGGTVNLYTSADSSSDVLATIRDGEQVEILNTYEDFYYVKYGELTGYVVSDQIKIGGLTTVQIVAIVLSIVVIFAGAAVFFVTSRLKKQAEDAEEN